MKFIGKIFYALVFIASVLVLALMPLLSEELYIRTGEHITITEKGFKGSLAIFWVVHCLSAFLAFLKLIEE